MQSPIRLVPLNPVAGAQTLWMSKGVMKATVIVKATFGMCHREPARWVAPRAIVESDRHYGGDPKRSLELASDLAPYLPGAGVTVVGNAHAPDGRPAPSFDVRLAIFRESAFIDKSLRILGEPAPPTGQIRPVATMPLIYERALRSADNPIGSPGPMSITALGPGASPGFGPIARTWPSRQRFLTGLDYRRLHMPLADIPKDFDWRYFQAAPEDQQMGFLQGDEWILLDGLNPRMPRVQTQLPWIKGRARWHSEQHGALGPGHDLELVADTVTIDAEAQLCSVVWRGHFDLDEAMGQVAVFIGCETLDRRIEWPEEEVLEPTAALPPVRAMPRTAPPPFREAIIPRDLDDDVEDDPLGRTVTLSGDHVRSARAIPATPWDGIGQQPRPTMARPRLDSPPRVPSPAGPAPPSTRGPLEEPADSGDRTETFSTKTYERMVARPSTPFVPATTPRVPPPAPPLMDVEDSTATTVVVPDEAAAASVGPTLVIELPAPAPPPPPPVAFAGSERRRSVVAKLATDEAFFEMDLAGAELAGLDFSGKTLDGCNLEGADLVGCRFEGARLRGARLHGADLTDAHLREADLSRADLKRARLGRASLEACLLDGADLTAADATGASFDGARGAHIQFVGCVLEGATLRGLEANEASFAGAQLERAVFEGARLVDAILSDARGEKAHFGHADLSRARASGASFADARFEGCTATSSVWEKADLSRACFDDAVLTGAVLSRAVLDGARFSRADLTSANLRNASGSAPRFDDARLEAVDLRQARLPNGTFERAILRRAQAGKADLSGANLQGADLTGALLRPAKLKRCDLRGAHLADADLRDADLEGANLSGVDPSVARIKGANLRHVVFDDPLPAGAAGDGGE